MSEPSETEMSPTGLPAMQTKRLRLVPYGLGPATVDAFCRITTDPAVYWWREEPYTVEQQSEHFLSGKLFEGQPDGMGYWAVFSAEDDALLGQVILQPLEDSGLIEIGWHFLANARGHGYATEAATRLMTYGFDVLEIDPIYAVIRSSNEPSIQVALRVGLRPDGEGIYYDKPHLRFRMMRSQHHIQSQEKTS
ncbi:MAG: GNAT family N-acetyltransferase [Candidatus Phaeomarinobacter sp.]